jgi:hypothetical protein
MMLTTDIALKVDHELIAGVIPVFGRLDEALTPPARSDLSG